MRNFSHLYYIFFFSFKDVVRPPAISILELRLHQFGLKPLDGGAGDCFFRVVSYQIYGNPNSHGIISVAGVELLREKRKYFLKVILNIRGYNI